MLVFNYETEQYHNNVVLLSLLRELYCYVGRKGTRFWSLNPSKGLSSHSFFLCLVNYSPLRDSVFASTWKMKISKVKFSVWQILQRENTLDRASKEDA